MRRRTRRPLLETLERRAVPSTLGTVVAASRVSAAEVAPPGATNEILDPTGLPTAHERLRQRFQATFTGPYVIGPGRFSSQKSQVLIRGAGTSNRFLHGDVIFKYATPRDPAVSSTGALTMFDRNANSGSHLGLALTAVPGASDRHGRPTQFAFVVDPTVSSGLFTGASGSGILDVRYRAAQATSGTASVRARGTVYTLGTTGSLRNADINP